MSANDERVDLAALNAMPYDDAVKLCGGFFEHSPWIVEAALHKRPFETVEAFHGACMDAVSSSSEGAKVALIRAHPDLVGRLARAAGLTRESRREQASAGLDALTAAEAKRLERYNAEYRERFGFPFVICARKNRTAAILEALPRRLGQTRDEEIREAIAQIGEIARLRMGDAIRDNA
jgi:2-oxo-4-hydroxy-4-carboxy-5-ureidoimidazoline decarboxylase